MKSNLLLKEQIRAKFLSGVISESEYQKLMKTQSYNEILDDLTDATKVSQWIEKDLNSYINTIEDNDESGSGNQIILKLQYLFLKIAEKLGIDKKKSLQYIINNFKYEDIKKTDGHGGYNIYGYVYLYKFKIVEYSSYENGHSFGGAVNSSELQQAVDEFILNVKQL